MNKFRVLRFTRLIHKRWNVSWLCAFNLAVREDKWITKNSVYCRARALSGKSHYSMANDLLHGWGND